MIKYSVSDHIIIGNTKYVVTEGPITEETGVSYIIKDQDGNYYDVEFQKEKTILAQAMKTENGWQFTNHKTI